MAERTCKDCFHYKACKEGANRNGFWDIRYTEQECKYFTPTADVVEVKHGEWKLCEDDSLICATEFTCSVCGESFCSSELTDKQMLEMMKYCSNCGAKMNKETELTKLEHSSLCETETFKG